MIDSASYWPFGSAPFARQCSPPGTIIVEITPNAAEPVSVVVSGDVVELPHAASEPTSDAMRGLFIAANVRELRTAHDEHDRQSSAGVRNLAKADDARERSG